MVNDLSNKNTYLIIIGIYLWICCGACNILPKEVRDPAPGYKVIVQVRDELIKNGHPELADDFFKSLPRYSEEEGAIVCILKEGDEQIDKLTRRKLIIEKFGSAVTGKAVSFKVITIPKKVMAIPKTERIVFLKT